MKTLLIACCASWLTGQALAQTMPEHLSAERQRLQAEREAIEQLHSARVHDCWQRFAVNDCLRQARRARYQALDPLRAHELQLNAQERDWRALEREDRLREKQDALEQRRP